MRTFVAKTTVNFPDLELYVRMGDLLVYDATNQNNLTIYRGGSIVKTIKTTPIAIAAMTKTKMLEEVVSKPAPASKVAASAAPKPAAAPKAAPKPKVEPKPKKEEKPVCPYGYDKVNKGTKHECVIHSLADYEVAERQEVADALGVPVDQIHKLPAPPEDSK